MQFLALTVCILDNLFLLYMTPFSLGTEHLRFYSALDQYCLSLFQQVHYFATQILRELKTSQLYQNRFSSAAANTLLGFLIIVRSAIPEFVKDRDTVAHRTVNLVRAARCLGTLNPSLYPSIRQDNSNENSDLSEPPYRTSSCKNDVIFE